MYKNVTQLMGCADSLVVHHDHFTGHICGLAHSFCYLQMRQYNMTSCDIFSHNAAFDLKYVMNGMLKNLTCLRGRDYFNKEGDKTKTTFARSTCIDHSTKNRDYLKIAMGNLTTDDLLELWGGVVSFTFNPFMKRTGVHNQ